MKTKNKKIFTLIAVIIFAALSFSVFIACNGSSENGGRALTSTPSTNTPVVGDTVHVTARIDGEDTINITMSASPANLVTINNVTRIITATAAGDVTITVSATDGPETTSFTLNISPPPIYINQGLTGLAIQPPLTPPANAHRLAYGIMFEGQGGSRALVPTSINLSAVPIPGTVNLISVTWSVSPTGGNVAVNSTGLVTVIGNPQASAIYTVTASAPVYIGSAPITASIQVEVVHNAQAGQSVGIGSRDELEFIRLHPNGDFHLTSNIAMGGTAGNPWIPIGTGANERDVGTPFTGTFDGRGFTISGIYVNAWFPYPPPMGYTMWHRGIFRYTNGATIKNLNIVNASIASAGGQGAVLVGNAVGTLIENVSIHGHLIGRDWGTSQHAPPNSNGTIVGIAGEGTVIRNVVAHAGVDAHVNAGAPNIAAMVHSSAEFENVFVVVEGVRNLYTHPGTGPQGTGGVNNMYFRLSGEPYGGAEMVSPFDSTRHFAYYVGGIPNENLTNVHAFLRADIGSVDFNALPGGWVVYAPTGVPRVTQL